MHTNINYLSAEHAAAVKQLATNIAAQVKVTAIVLYGMRTHGSLIWSAPNMLAPAPQPIGLTVDLLVITQKGETKNARSHSPHRRHANAGTKYHLHSAHRALHP